MCGRLQEVDLFACYTCSKLQLHSSRINFDDRLFCLLPLCSSFFTFHSLSSLLLTFSIICVSLFCSSHFSFPLSLSAAAHSVFVSCPYIPSSASPPPPPQPALSVCKMIAAVELLPTPGALMKAVLRWKQGERGTNCTLCTEQRQRTCLSMAGLNHVVLKHNLSKNSNK